MSANLSISSSERMAASPRVSGHWLSFPAREEVPRFSVKWFRGSVDLGELLVLELYCDE